MTPQQIATLKAFILATPAMASKPMNGDGDFEITEMLRMKAVPAFQVWNENASVSDVSDSIIWANMTPSAPLSADSTGIYRDRALACQGKQFNLQTILQGRTTIDATKSNLRGGLQDALTAIPSKVDGSNQNAGWVAVQLALQRTATVFEKLFATGVGSTASPATVTLSQVSQNDVNVARNS